MSCNWSGVYIVLKGLWTRRLTHLNKNSVFNDWGAQESFGRSVSSTYAVKHTVFGTPSTIVFKNYLFLKILRSHQMPERSFENSASKHQVLLRSNSIFNTKREFVKWRSQAWALSWNNLWTSLLGRFLTEQCHLGITFWWFFGALWSLFLIFWCPGVVFGPVWCPEGFRGAEPRYR